MRTAVNFDPGILTDFYTENGLFAKIVDMPAEDAALKGFDLEGISRPARSYYRRELERINWPEAASTALKWQRLFGGALAVVFVDDGRGLEDPLDLERVRAVDGLQVFESPVVQVELDAEGEPVSFTLNSKRACCTVHPSRCLLFRSDPLPEASGNPAGEFWGPLLYGRIEKALQAVIVSHGYAPKILQRDFQAVLKEPGMSELLSTAKGEQTVKKRLEALNMSRGLLNTLLIDTEEDLQFIPPIGTKFSIAELIKLMREELSSVTGMPVDWLASDHITYSKGGGVPNPNTSSVLKPRTPLEIERDRRAYFMRLQDAKYRYASFIRGIQEETLKAPLLRLLEIIGRAGVAAGELRTVEPVRVKWRPLYQGSELEKAENALTKARTDQTRAETLAGQVVGGIITPAEARRIIKGKKM